MAGAAFLKSSVLTGEDVGVHIVRAVQECFQDAAPMVFHVVVLFALET
jgi:hypothetical protein